MFYKHFKRLSRGIWPRRLFGRSILMIVLPLVLLQLVVAVIFIDRYYDGGIHQLSENVIKTVQVISTLQEQNALTPSVIKAFYTEADIDIRLESVVPPLVDVCLPQKDYTSVQDVIQTTLDRLTPDRFLTSCPLASDPMIWHLVLTQKTHQGDLVYLVMTLPQRILSNAKWHFLLVWMVCASVVFTAISLVFLKNQMKPLRGLAEAAKAFGHGIEKPFHPSGSLEIRQAGQAFIHMRSRIKNHVEQHRLFLAGVSHDLRTVLTRLKLGVSLLPPSEDIAPLSEDITLMQTILDAYLDFARGTEGGASESVPLNLDAFLQEILIRFQDQFPHLEWIYEQSPTPSNYTLDSLKLRRCLENILGNASKWANTTVLVRLAPHFEADKKGWCLQIEDDGVGIPDTLRESVLKPFFQGNPARPVSKNKALGGLGLGLAIADTMMHHLGGHLDIKSSARLGGACLRLIF